MCPLYEWKCKKKKGKGTGKPCHHEQTIIRKHQEDKVPPEKCEKCGNTDEKLWEKFIGSPPGEQFGWGWGGGKGNWLLLVAGSPVAQFAYELLTGGNW